MQAVSDRQTSSKIKPSPSRLQRHQRRRGAYTMANSAADDAADNCNWPFKLMVASHPDVHKGSKSSQRALLCSVCEFEIDNSRCML